MNYTIILAVIAVMVVVVAADYFLRQRRKVTPDQGCTAEGAWDDYLAHPENCSSRDRQAIEKLSQRQDGAAEVRRSMGQTVDKALAAPNPTAALRLAIMEATDRFVMAETLYGERPQPEHMESVLEAGALRRYSALRFGDFEKEDWYTHYLQMAEMNAKNVAQIVRKTVRGESSSLESSLHDPLTDTMREIREVLLHYPPRTPVRKEAALVSGEPRADLYPSQQQIDQLTDVMSERFQKLFSGQVYRSEGGPLLDPSGTFQIDAALLYTVLSLRFRHSTDAWRKIMHKALGQYREAMQNEDRLLEIARESSRTWMANKQDGPLNASLRAASRDAFEDSTRPADVSGMMEDAGVLVGKIQEVVEG